MTLPNDEADRAVLSSELTIRHISIAREIIADRLENASSLSIELPESADVDLSLVQLIEAARVHAAACGKSLSLASPAEGALLDVLERSGFLTEATPDTRAFWLHEES